MKQASPKAGRPKTILSTNRKVQTQKRRRLLIWTLSSSRLKLMVELNQFCRNLLERTEEKRRRIRTGESSQSSAQYKLTVILRRNQYIFNITKNNEFEKSRKVLAAKPIRKSVVLTRARRRKRTASCSGQPWRRRGCLFFLFWIRRPQSSCAPKNCVVVFIQNFGIRARKYQSSDTLLSSTAPVFTGGN